MLADQLDYVVGVDPHRDSHALAVVEVRTGAVVSELLNDDYPSGDAWVESHYRWAVKGMAAGEEPEVAITRKAALTPKGRPARSLKLPDTIMFR